ncbi:MAG: hypothetical protein QF794_02775 [Candidatus Marinimicrobia bacterium]|nr:hypothetical protein [Candidatus Neomarinimicrobiota bacterium]
MDYRERSYRYLFWRKLFISLIAIGLVYILFIRPVQSFVVREFILPAFDSFITPESEIVSSPGVDEFFLSSLSDSFPRVKIEVPFNGYFWLAMSMIWPTKNKQFGRVVWNYNLVLFAIIPLSALGIIHGFTWLAPVVNVHEKVYKALFLILGILAVRETDELLKN